MFFSAVSKMKFNPYPANVENVVSSKCCQQMADGI